MRRVRTWTCAKRRDLQGGFLALWAGFRGAGAVLEWRRKALPPGKTEGVNTSRREAVMGTEAREGEQERRIWEATVAMENKSYISIIMQGDSLQVSC